MPLFDAYHVYSVNPETTAFDCRVGTDVAPTNPLMRTAEYQLPFTVSGLNIYDLAVFASIIDENGGQEYAYLVTRTGDESQLVRPSMIETDWSFLTAELAARFATVTPEEIASLGIERIVEIARRQHPDARGLSY